MEYKSWILRRQVLCDRKIVFIREALIVLDSVDWNEGVREFKDRDHFLNWCNSIATKFGVKDDPEAGLSGQELIRQAVLDLVEHGYATLDKQTGKLTLMQKD